MKTTSLTASNASHGIVVQSLADVLAAIIAKEPDMANELLAAVRAKTESGIFPKTIASVESAPKALIPLQDPALKAAEADVEAAKDLLSKAIARRSEVLGGIHAQHGAGPYAVNGGERAQIVARKSLGGTTYFLRVYKD